MPGFLQLSHIIQLDNDTYINTISSLSVNPEGDFLLLDSHRGEGYIVPASSAGSLAGTRQTYEAEPTVDLAYEQCGMDSGFSPYRSEFVATDSLIVYNLHDRPLLFDSDGNCLARLSFPAAGQVKRRYAQYAATDADRDSTAFAQPVRGIWTHEVDAENRHLLRYQSFRRIRSEERLIHLEHMRLPVMNRFQNGGGLFLHQPSQKLFMIGASSAHVYEVAVPESPGESSGTMQVYQPEYERYKNNPSDLPAGLPPSRRIPRMVQAIQEYGFVETVYRLDEHRLLLLYKRRSQQQPQQLDDDGLPVESETPPAEPTTSLLMLFDMQQQRFADKAYSLAEGEFITSAGNGFVYIARRSEEASLERGIINPLIYVYELTTAE